MNLTLHMSVADQLIKIFEMYGGHREQTRLRNELTSLVFGVYNRQDGKNIIVLQKDLDQAQNQR